MIKNPGARPRVLFVGEAVSLAHVVRPLVLAKALNPQHYDIHFACGEKYRSLLQKEGFSVHGLPTLASTQFMKRMAAGAPIYDEQTIEEYVKAELELLGRLKPDFIVGDFRISLSISAEHLGIPYANLCNAHWSPYSTQPFPTPELPLVRAIGPKVAGKILRMVIPLAFKYQALGFNRIRRQYRLPPVRNICEMYTRGDWTLYADLPKVAPTECLPAHHSYLGPITWSPAVPMPPKWNEIRKQKPVVYLALGSSGDLGVLRYLFDALAKAPVTVAMATAGRIQHITPPSNFFVTDYLPGQTILKDASVCICSGGAATGYQALREGVPLLSFPSNADQFFHATQIAQLGAGCVIRPSQARVRVIDNALERMLKDPCFGVSARSLQGEFKTYPAVERFRTFIERVLSVPRLHDLVRSAVGINN